MARYPLAFAPAIVILLHAGPVQADFYNLEGRYQCLGKADSVCDDATPDKPDEKAAKPGADGEAKGPGQKGPGRKGPGQNSPAPDAAPQPGSPEAAVEPGNGKAAGKGADATRKEKAGVKAPKSEQGPAVATAPPASGSLAPIVQRINAGKVSEADLVALQEKGKEGNPQALELLAWCHFAGIGLPRDPVQAYLYYGQAARAGSSSAAQNQARIFEGSLNQEQKQQALSAEAAAAGSSRK